MGDALPRPSDREVDDYEVIRVSISWGVMSIAAFVAILALQIFGFRVFDLRIAQITLATLGLSAVGFALGLIGMRFGRGRKAARLGAFLNGVVLFCVFVLLPLTYQLLRAFR